MTTLAEAVSSIVTLQYYVDGQPVGGALTIVPFRLNNLDLDSGEHVLTAVFTDNAGRIGNAVPSRITTTSRRAGKLALQSRTSSASVQPGGLIVYRLTATNTGTTRIDAATVTAVVPEHTAYVSAFFVDVNGQPIASPRGVTGRNPQIAAEAKSVLWTLINIRPGASVDLQLTVRVEYDFPLVLSPVTNLNFRARAPSGRITVPGFFPEVPVQVTGPAPANRPALTLVKLVTNRPGSPLDDPEIIEDAERGSVFSVDSSGKRNVVTFTLVAVNYGTEVAERVVIKDEIPDRTLPIGGMERVNGRIPVAGSFAHRSTGNARGIDFHVGTLRPGDRVVVSHQITVPAPSRGGPSFNTFIESTGATVRTASLTATPESFPAQINLKVIGHAEFACKEVRSIPARPVAGQQITYFLSYGNIGGKDLNDVRIYNELPAGVTFQQAYLNTPGVTLPPTLSGSAQVFRLGTLSPGASGELKIVGLVTSAVFDDPKALMENRYDIYDNRFFPPPTAARFAVAAAGLSLEVPGAFKVNRATKPGVPQLCISKIFPTQVAQGGEFSYILVIGNLSDAAAAAGIVMDFPANAEFIGADFPNRSESGGYSAGIGPFQAHSAFAVTLKFRATGPPGSVIFDASSSVETDDIHKVYAGVSTTLITAPNTSVAPDEAAGNYLQSVGSGDAISALAIPSFTDAFRAASVFPRNCTVIGGADYVTLRNGAVLIPLGGGNVVASGGGNLIANDGGSLIANDGGTLVAQGGGNLIAFNNLIGNDGGTLTSRGGSTILAQFENADAANLVAQGGGNIVASGGGNLVATDGASLIGNDVGTFGVSISTLLSKGGRALVAQGGGNLVAQGGGNLVAQGGGNLVAQGGGNLVAQGGGNIIASGGGNLRLDNGTVLLSTDASLVFSIGLLDGNMVAGGGGNLLINSSGR